MKVARENARLKRHLRIRKKVKGTPERPRLSVYRSNMNLNIQLVDDYAEKTLFSLSTLNADFRKDVKKRGNLEASKQFGKYAAEIMKKKGFQKIAFDRGGFLYHGRVKALADAIREGGIEF